MAACQDVRQWFTKSVLTPVTQFFTEAREKCDEVRQRIEEQVSQPVERWVSEQERHCRELPWWNPLRWFCEIVIIVVKVVVWVVVTVVKWVVTIVCQVVVAVIGIIVTFVLRLISWVVTFVVCLVTDPWEALKSLLDLWAIVLDTIGSIIDLVGTLLDDVLGILDDVEDLLDSLADSLGWLGVIFGVLKGLIHLVREVVSIVKDVVDAVKDILLGLLGGNLCRLLRGLTNLGTGLGRALLASGFGVLTPVRFIGYAVGGVRDSVDHHQLEEIITSAINNAFGAGSVRAGDAIRAVGIGSSPMGLRFEADARRMFLSSDSLDLDLRVLHKSGVIDLFALAGLGSTCGEVINAPQGEVVYADTNLPVSYADLWTFLAGGPGSVPEFHVFAITRALFRSHLEVARRKAQALGVRLFFPVIGSIQATSTDHVPLNVSDGGLPGDGVQQVLFQRMGRIGGGMDDLSVLPSISHFHYILDKDGHELFGLTSSFRPARDDTGPSGVTYRNRTPDWGFRWVLVHEMGHYWGLKHTNREGGERSIDEIMYAPSTKVGVSGSAVLEYLALGGEPRFTLDDARTTWDWITTDGAASLLP
jgi:hypothetical protein